MVKTGVVHHNWGGYDLDGFAARAAEIGYRYCELQFGDVWPDGTRDGERAAVEVREKLESRGISVSAVSAGNNFLRADPAQQQAEIDRYRKVCEWIPHTGTDIVRSDGGWGEEVPRDQWDGMMLEAFKRCVDFAETSGVRIAPRQPRDGDQRRRVAGEPDRARRVRAARGQPRYDELSLGRVGHRALQPVLPVGGPPTCSMSI